MHFGRELHQVASGRIFIRGAVAQPDTLSMGRPQADYAAASARLRDAILLVGVIEIPKQVDVERMHDVRLNDHLWLDAENARQPRTSRPGMVREMDVGGVLQDFKYARGFLPDAFEVFVRATMLPHDKADMRWAYIMAPVAHRLDALPNDGLYEFGAGTTGFRQLSDDIHVGEPPSSILRTAQWGPGGAFGMSTSMEPTHFPAWLAQQRSSSNRHADPKFPLFAHLMGQRCPELHVYTAEQSKERDAVCGAVMREVAAMSDEELDAATSQIPAPSQEPGRRRRMCA